MTDKKTYLTGAESIQAHLDDRLLNGLGKFCPEIELDDGQKVKHVISLKSVYRNLEKGVIPSEPRTEKEPYKTDVNSLNVDPGCNIPDIQFLCDRLKENGIDVPERTLYRYVEQGKLPADRVGGKYIFNSTSFDCLNQESLEKIVKERRKKPTDVTG
jgi:hypothetical protein